MRVLLESLAQLAGALRTFSILYSITQGWDATIILEGEKGSIRGGL